MDFMNARMHRVLPQSRVSSTEQEVGGLSDNISCVLVCQEACDIQVVRYRERQRSEAVWTSIHRLLDRWFVKLKVGRYHK